MRTLLCYNNQHDNAIIGKYGEETYVNQLLRSHLEEIYETVLPGSLYLKRDDLLPIAGTIKLRGAIYEVLKHAETVA